MNLKYTAHKLESWCKEAKQSKKFLSSKFIKGVDIEKLVQPEVGKHNPQQKNSKDKAVEEHFSASEIIGENYNRVTKKYEQTRRVCIKHNRKKGWHSFPVHERKGDQNGEG